MNEVSLRMIEIVARGLGELNDHVAFVGGEPLPGCMPMTQLQKMPDRRHR